MMIYYIYTFRNEETGQTVQAESHSKNAAARMVGIDVPHRGQMPHPWKAIACHTRDGGLMWTEE